MSSWSLIPLDVRDTAHPLYPAWEIFQRLPAPFPRDGASEAAATLIAWEAFAAGYRAGVFDRSMSPARPSAVLMTEAERELLNRTWCPTCQSHFCSCSSGKPST